MITPFVLVGTSVGWFFTGITVGYLAGWTHTANRFHDALNDLRVTNIKLLMAIKAKAPASEESKHQIPVRPMSKLSDKLAEISAIKTVEESAFAWISGEPDRTQAAINKAIGLGATEEQLQPFFDKIDEEKAAADQIVAAIVANTPAAPVPAVPTDAAPAGQQ